MADDAIDAASDQSMPGLDGDQPAEPTAEHKDRPDPQHTAGGKESDANPANGIPVEGPEPLAVRIGRQIGGQQPDQPEGWNDPAVGAILALAGAAALSAITSPRCGATGRPSPTCSKGFLLGDGIFPANTGKDGKKSDW